jgi:minor extracellular serine protease Vpr
MRPVAVLLLLLIIPCGAFARDLTRYVLVLTDPPASAAGDRTAMAAARLRNIDAHVAVRAWLNARNLHITAETHVLLNAIFVSADPAQAAQLRAAPGVRYVARVPRYHRSLDRAIQLINVPAAWNTVGGASNAGAGIRIAIIDTGIQSSAAAFQDATLTPPANFPVCSIAQLPFGTLDCTQYTNNKIIAARSYVPMIAAGYGAVPAANSRPDDYTPRDHVGHGTAVAMAAAGLANTGPSDTITGVAPKAFLGSYKVFGSPGVNDFTSSDAIVAALEDAFYNDQMDIAVLALGAPALFAPQDLGSTCGASANTPCDPEAVAVQNAVNAGMLVIAAAGNEGANGSSAPTLATIDSPADAPGAIAVGATTNSHNWANPLTVTGLGTFHSLTGGGPAPVASFGAPLADAVNAGDSQACNSLTPASLNGAFALVERGTCDFVTKVQNLEAAGAVGAIITNSDGDDSLLSPGGLNGVTSIPAALIGYDDGQTIRNFLQTTPSATASLSPLLQPFDVTTGNQVSSFSSRGPAIGSGAIKPDIVAVGDNLYLTGQTYDPNGELYSPTGYLVSQGTSFSTPQIAGVAALIKQQNPKLTAGQIKSALLNTATQDVTDNTSTASVLAVGAGKASAAAAVTSNLAASPASASFGILTATSLPLNQAIQLTNTGGATLNLSIALNRRTAENNAHTSIDHPSITLPAGQSTTLNLSLTGTLPTAGIYEGFVTIQGAASTLQIPYLYVVGDGVPWNIVPLVGNNDDGTVGQSTSEGAIILQLTDRYGAPVVNAPVSFSAVGGGGSLQFPDATTDIYGLAGAEPVLGPAPGVNAFIAITGGLSAEFDATARLQPTISTNGVVDAASFVATRAVAPGSYVAIFGSNLSDVTQVASTPNLPVAIGDVSVSFDSSTTSAPGHLFFATPGQINVQVPWELQGQASVQTKVSVEDSSGALYSLPLAKYSPGIFQIPEGGATYAAARDENFNTIGPGNPAVQGHNIQIYCNGLGPVNNQPASGDPSPSSPLATTTAVPTVTIGGQNATVLYSGLAPTTVGLYQLNVTVPNTGAGVKPVIISIGGISSTASNMVVQ